MTCKDCIHYEACKTTASYFGCSTNNSHTFATYELRQEIEKDCADFKDKSRFIELPCKVGDMLHDVYDAITNGVGGIKELKVPEIHINLDRRNRPWIVISGYYFAFEDFGKTVFLTKEEAEKALAERKRKQ